MNRPRSRQRIIPRLGMLAGVLITLAGVSLLSRAAMSGLSAATTFTVEELRVEGNRYLDPAELIALAQPARLTSEEVDDEDLEMLGERISAHPLVERVVVHRSLPASVVIEVEELVPVAFLEGYPVRGVDGRGRVLEQLEPPRYGALPFITGTTADPVEGEASGALWRAVKALQELSEHAPRLLDRVSEVQPRVGGEIALVLTGDAVVVRLAERSLERMLPLVGALVMEGRRRHAPLAEVDLRFENTVIYRERKGGP